MKNMTTTKRNPVPPLRSKRMRVNPRSFSNIEKSGFHKGEYVGYGGGDVWRIRKAQYGWQAIAPKTHQLATGKTLDEISRHLLSLKAIRPNPAQRAPKSSSTWGVPSRQRKVAEFAANDRVAKVYYTSDLGEYQVKYWMGGIRQEPWDYFTDDLDDAKNTAQTALRFENPAQSPALGMSKAAYINRKSQITKKKPAPRLKKRRNYAYLMAQRGFAGAFPNPIGESEWQWVDYDVRGNAKEGYKVNQAFRTKHKVMLKDNVKLTDMLKALRASGVLGSKATSKSVAMEHHDEVIYFTATEDGYPLGELREIC